MPSAPSTVTFVSEDPDAYWERIAPHVLHETNMYADWAEKAQVFSPYKHFDSSDDLRSSGAYKVYRPQELIDAARDMVGAQPIMFHPLCGGIHPDLAWSSLHLLSQMSPTSSTVTASSRCPMAPNPAQTRWDPRRTRSHPDPSSPLPPGCPRMPPDALR